MKPGNRGRFRKFSLFSSVQVTQPLREDDPFACLPRKTKEENETEMKLVTRNTLQTIISLFLILLSIIPEQNHALFFG